MRAFFVAAFIALAFAASLHGAQRITRQQTSRAILNEYAVLDCAGYLRSHSAFYRRTFAAALAGDPRALRRVFSDPLFHSGDNDAWSSIPGAILYVLGDARFFHFARSLSKTDRFWALTYISLGEPFQYPDERRGLQFLKRQFPKTYRLYRESDTLPRPGSFRPAGVPEILTTMAPNAN